MSPRAVLEAIAAVVLIAAPLQGQQQTISGAFELERSGQYAAAASAYHALLTAKPADPAALLGLERVLVPLNRTAELLPALRAALAVDSTGDVVSGVAMRAWAAAGQPDSMRAVAERWARASPTSEAPYREWGAAALTRHDRQGAIEAFTLGRERLGRADALAAERAQLATMEGEYVSALREWLPAVRRAPAYRVAAVSSLEQAPDSLHPALLRALHGEDDEIARRMEAELRARWGDPAGAMNVLLSPLGNGRAVSADALRGIIDQLRTQPAPEARLALARGLEALSERALPGERARLRLDAARAYTVAGNREAARRMLAGIAGDSATPGPVAAGAAAALIQVLIGEGRLDEAGHRLAEASAGLSNDERASLRLRLADAWTRQGKLNEAESVLGADSTVEAMAVQGKIRLFRGDIAGAVERLTAAGPFAGDRDQATNRTSLLAMLQPIEVDTLPALGKAMLLLEQGDTAHAVNALEGLARGLPPAAGGAEVAMLAGRLASARGERADAERLYGLAAVVDAPATAPAAELALGELLLSDNRPAEAIARLEHMILTYPESALVPQARRRLDQARGAVPKT